MKFRVPNNVHEALIELEHQIAIVEPHSDSDTDCEAYGRAMDILHRLILWSERECDAERIIDGGVK